MSKSAMKEMNVQKWIYERGNYQIIVENAWSLKPFYTQERITVNGERIRDVIPIPTSIIFWRTMFEDTVLEPGRELSLKLQWKSGFMTVKARLLLEGEKLDWTEYYQLRWTGARGDWPEPSEYDEIIK